MNWMAFVSYYSCINGFICGTTTQIHIVFFLSNVSTTELLVLSILFCDFLINQNCSKVSEFPVYLGRYLVGISNFAA